MPVDKYQLPQGKRIHVYRSGDQYYTGANLTVNPLQTKTIDNLLGDVTKKVNPDWGAVRSIHTPNSGTVVQNLEQLQRQGHYVAAGPKGFFTIPGGYDKIGKTGVKQKHGVQKLLHKPVDKNTTISLLIYRNGDDQTRPINVRLNKSDFVNWNRVLDKLSEIVILSDGPIKRVYNLTGSIVKNPQDLKDGDSYVVATANQSFRKQNYENDDKIEDDPERGYGTIDTGNEMAKPKGSKSINKDSSNPSSRLATSKNRHQSRRQTNKFVNKKKSPSVKASILNKGRGQPKRNSSAKGTAKILSVNEGSQSSSKHHSKRTSLKSNESESDQNYVSSPIDKPENSFTKNADVLNSSQTRVDYLNIQENTMVTSVIQETPLISAEGFYSERETPSKIVPERHSQSQRGSTHPYQKSQTETGEYYEEYGNSRPISGISQSMSLLSLVDSGHASLLSEDDRPDSIFRSKRKSRPTTQAIEVDYDTDDSGLFRARSRNIFTRGATEINDSTDTRIELPLDFIEASEVQEEEVY